MKEPPIISDYQQRPLSFPLTANATKTSKAKMWCGILSPLWFVLGFVIICLLSLSGNFQNAKETMVSDYFYVFGIGIYFGIGLLLSVSGIRSGRLEGQVLGVLTIMLFILLLLIALNPGGISD
jgi:EamA domain-containing membrane protein RarD